jgi:hypothetical protein
MQTLPPVYIIGDVHGQLNALVKLLRQAHLVEEDLSWRGGNAILWFIGDLVDRGPDSLAVLDLVMHLQVEAASGQGQVASLLGNHELLLLAAYRLGRRSTGLGSNFLAKWKHNGGVGKDLSRLTLQQVEWLTHLPAMASVGNRLLIHADAPFYLRYGRSIEEVNTTISALLKQNDALAWEELLEEFARRGTFASGEDGEALARRFLTTYGGEQLVHGHTPISSLIRRSPKTITTAWIYAAGHCVNVDGGMYLGGPGFLYQLPQGPADRLTD